MVNVPAQDIRLRFGRLVRPDFKTNVRQQAVIRKLVEFFGLEHAQECVGQLTRLQAVMGTAHTFHEFGKLKVNFIHNGHLVARETDPPPLEIQTQLRGYLASYNAYLMKHGNDYTVRNPAAKSQLQDAEQAWHDCIVPSLAARGLGPRPDWALEPLPGLRRVRIAPAPAATSARAPAHAPAPPRARGPPPIRLHTDPCPRSPSCPLPNPSHHSSQPFPPLLSTLPTTPPNSPARSTAPEVIDLTHIDYEPARRAPKRRFPEVIHVSDDEDDVEPCKSIE
ncbi:hypothetical protein DFH09DRAFT_1328875 [Mycena vulgaris]|nr:hypothetical protein DFH09DRAFT_1328875 [Mycena vulgaris]